jgi:hypothetical protein
VLEEAKARPEEDQSGPPVVEEKKKKKKKKAARRCAPRGGGCFSARLVEANARAVAPVAGGRPEVAVHVEALTAARVEGSRR